MTGTPNTAMSVTGSTADLIREGREKLRGVTEGEWAAESRYAVFGYVTDVRSTATETVAGHDCVTMVSHGLAESDAEFIVWARNNMAAVLEALRAEQKDGEIIANTLDEERAYSAHLRDEVTRAKEWQGIGAVVRFAEFQEARRWAEWFAAERDHIRVVRRDDLDCCERTTAALAEANATIERVRALANDGQTVGWVEHDGDVAWVAADAIRRAIEGPAT